MQRTDVRLTVQPRHGAAPGHSWGWPLVLVVSALGVGGVALGVVPFPVRALLVIWFLCLCPGMAFVRLLDIADRYMQLTLAVALSLALDTAVATALLYAHMWSPAPVLGILAGLSLGAVVLDVTVVHRRRRPAGTTGGVTSTFQSAQLVAVPEVVQVVPGERLVLALTVHNNRSMASHFYIDVSGLPAQWYDLATPHVLLGPGSSECVELTVHPPAGTVPTTNSCTMSVRTMAEDGLSVEAAIIVRNVQAATTARVLVSTRDGLGMEVQPAEVVGEEATFSVAFLNRSTAPVTIESVMHPDLVVQAHQNGLRVHVTPQTRVFVPAGAAAGPLTVHVVPKRWRLRGVPRPYEIAFRGRQLGRETLMHPDLVLPARFTYMPRDAAPALRRWGRRVAVVLLLLLLAFVGAHRLATVPQHAPNRPIAPSTGVTRQQGPANRVHGRSTQPRVALRNPTRLSSLALLNPPKLSWGDHSVHTASVARLIHVVNLGPTPLTVRRVLIGGINPRDFKARSTCAHRTLGNYDGCFVAVHFTPLASGTRRATLIVTYKGVDDLQEVPLTGHGRAQRR